jgi:hypothetical protein
MDLVTKELQWYFFLEASLLTLLLILMASVGPSTDVSIYTTVKYYSDLTVTLSTSRSIHLPEKVLVCLAVAGRLGELGAMLTGQSIWIKGAARVVRSSIGYSWAIYTCGLRDVFTFFLVVIYATILGIGFQYHEFAFKSAVDDTYTSGLYSFYRLILFLQVVVICVVTLGLSEDLASAGEVSTFPIAVLLGGNALELFHRGIQERYFTEIITETYQDLAKSIGPNELARYSSMFDVVFSLDRSSIILWELYVNVADVSKIFALGILFLTLADTAAPVPTYIRT